MTARRHISPTRTRRDPGRHSEAIFPGETGYASATIFHLPAALSRKLVTMSRVPRKEDLAGKSALETGAAQAIGRTVAFRLAKEGAAVVVCDLDWDAGRCRADEVVATGTQASFVAADVTREDGVAAMVAQPTSWQEGARLSGWGALLPAFAVTVAEAVTRDRALASSASPMFERPARLRRCGRLHAPG